MQNCGSPIQIFVDPVLPRTPVAPRAINLYISPGDRRQAAYWEHNKKSSEDGGKMDAGRATDAGQG